MNCVADRLITEFVFAYHATMRLKDDAKLDAVVAATCRLAAERGLLGLNLTDIAKAAGIGTSTLYVYFADKEALLNEAYRRAKRAAIAFYGAEIDPQAPLRLRVRGVWNRMLDHRLHHHEEVSFMEQFMASSFMNEESRAYAAQLGEALVGLVAEGQAAEILKPVPIPFLSALFIGSVRETARLIRAQSVADSDESRAIAFQLCWEGIRC
jgi:AcrR family transcriptional regulator